MERKDSGPQRSTGAGRDDAMKAAKWLACAWYDLWHALSADPEETYLVAYPKCGSTWLHFMVLQALSRAYGIELGPTIESTKVTREHPELPTVVWTHDKSLILTEGGERIDPERLFVYGRRMRYRRNRVILLVRDPRDVVVSHYYQTTRRSASPMVFDNMGAFIRDPLLGFRRIIRFYRIWDANWAIPRGIMLVRYEDLLARGVEVLGEVLRFLDVTSVPRAKLEEAYAFSTAHNMRQMELQGRIGGLRSRITREQYRDGNRNAEGKSVAHHFSNWKRMVTRHRTATGLPSTVPGLNRQVSTASRAACSKMAAPEERTT